MDCPLVTIIVPVYNSEKYIKECIEKLLSQTYNNIQIILVNDGSTDNSHEICESFSDRRITLLKKENGGASSARNYGLSRAKGDYILFADSDDYLEKDAVKTLVDLSRNQDPDLIYFEADNYTDDNSIKIKEKGFSQKSDYPVCSGDKLIPLLLKNKDYHAAPFLFFIRSSVFDNGLCFKEGIMMEDELFSFQLFRSCSKVVCLKKELYHRRVRPGSVMTSTGKEVFRYISIETVFNELLKEKVNDVYDNTLKKYIARTGMLVIGYWEQLPKTERKNMKERFMLVRKKIRANKGFENRELLVRTYGVFPWFVYILPDRIIKKIKRRLL